jgi:hypothetical protein
LPAIEPIIVDEARDVGRTRSASSTTDRRTGHRLSTVDSEVLLCQVPATGWAALWPRLQHHD